MLTVIVARSIILVEYIFMTGGQAQVMFPFHAQYKVEISSALKDIRGKCVHYELIWYIALKMLKYEYLPCI